MASVSKQVRSLARTLLKLSIDNGRISPERVGGVLAYVEKHRPAHPAAVLKAYRRLVERELALGEALVEHAGAMPAGALPSISTALTRHYGRPISTAARPNTDLIAGLRIRVGDDVYESSVAGRLAALSAAL